MMEYKGYKGQVEYDDEAKIFHGRVTGIRGVITFEADSVKELEHAFQDSIEDYLVVPEKLTFVTSLQGATATWQSRRLCTFT